MGPTRKSEKKTEFILLAPKPQALIPPVFMRRSAIAKKKRSSKWLLIGRRDERKKLAGVVKINFLVEKTVLDSHKIIIGMHSRRFK